MSAAKQQKTSATKTSKSEVDKYIDALPPDARATLEKLRQTIKAVVPEATEVISYGIPTFKHQGQPLVAYAAFRNHCSFFPASTSVLAAHKEDLKGYETSKGTIRFPIGESLPATLVKKLVKARVAENKLRSVK
jgi:uncharacterized protein YdhG (YjbR/CyaY superfamily)